MASCAIVPKTGPKVPMALMLYIIIYKPPRLIQQNKSKMVILWIESLKDYRVHNISNVL